MATKYTTEIQAADFDQVRSIVASSTGTVEVWGDPDASVITIALDEAAIVHLGERGMGEVWSFSADGVCPALYADGGAYPVTVIHNA